MGKSRIEKLRQTIKDMCRWSEKNKTMTPQDIKDMYYRIGMKKALRIIEGKDE